MSFAQTRQGLRSAVFAALGEPALINDGPDPVNVRTIERDEALPFGEARLNAAAMRIEAPTSLGLKRGDIIELVGDGRRFKVNSPPVVVRSGVHSLSCEVAP